MKIDLHFHFRKNKEDRIQRLESMVKNASSHGIEGIALLDHNYFPDKSIMAIAKSAAPNIVFWRACELDVVDNVRKMKNHIVVLSETALPFDYSKGITTSNLQLLARFSTRDDVVTMLAHPFRKEQDICFDFSQFQPDLIDSIGRTANQHRLMDVVNLASRWKMRLACASDSHKCAHTGNHWMNLTENVSTVCDLKKLINNGKYTLNAHS